MHELAVCQALIGEVAAIARARRARAVTDVFVSVGRLSGVEVSLLERAFPIAAAGSVAGRAALHVEDLPVRIRCDLCGADSVVDAGRLVCPSCGNWRTRVVGGDELLLERVVLDAGEGGDLHV